MTNKHGEKIPNLFIVGAPKCGTSSLHYWLSQHPEIFMSKPKEPRFFCTDQIKEADNFHNKKVDYFQYRQWEEYLNLFKTVGDEKIAGESTPRYLYSHEAPKNIYNFNKNSKIIILLREPFEFLRSYHSQTLKNHENIKNFEKAIQVEEKRKKGEYKIPFQAVAPSVLYYSDKAKFSYYIYKYLKTFPNNQVKIILFNNIKNNPLYTYKSILNFLNVENINFKPILEKKNPNKLIKIKFFHHFLQSREYTTIKKPLQKILPKAIRKEIYFFIKNKNETIQPREPLNKDFEFKLKKQFKIEVNNLSQITKKDLLKLWGYDKIN